jgi:ATP-binding cassette subfamily B protein
MLKRFWQLVGQYQRLSLLVPLLVVLGEVFALAVPLLMAQLVDQGLTPGKMEVVWFYGEVLVVVTLVALGLMVTAGILAARVATGFAHNLRRAMFERIQEFSFANLDRLPPSSLITRLTSDVGRVQDAFGMLLRMAVRAPAAIIIALIMTVFLSPKLSLIFLGILPLLAVAMYFLITKVQPIFQRLFKIYDRLNLVVEENLRGIRVVKTYVRANHEIKKFQRVSTQIYHCWSQGERIMAVAQPLMMLMMNTCLLFLAWFGAHLIVSDEFTTGGLLSLFAYAMQILMSLMMVAMVFVMLATSRASAVRINEVLTTISDLIPPRDGRKCVANGELEFRAVDFSYVGRKDKLALKKLDFKITSGQTIGIIGATGSGKTSLVGLIPRLYDVTAGRVLVGGQDVRDYDLAALRRQVAIVLQKNVLFSGTIRTNLLWGNHQASLSQLKRACQLAAASEFIEKLPAGYDAPVDQGGLNFSGGQKQRLCLARAILAEPKILIFDDATSSVDTKTEARIIQGLAQSLPQTTKIIISQRLSSIQHADQILVLADGQINDWGTPAQLLKRNQIYRDVYHSAQRKDVDVT